MVAPDFHLLPLCREHWAIENKSHSRRDETLHADVCRLAIGHVPQAIAVLNNLGFLRWTTNAKQHAEKWAR